jgi:hypothetical protein
MSGLLAPSEIIDEVSPGGDENYRRVRPFQGSRRLKSRSDHASRLSITLFNSLAVEKFVITSCNIKATITMPTELEEVRHTLTFHDMLILISPP